MNGGKINKKEISRREVFRKCRETFRKCRETFKKYCMKSHDEASSEDLKSGNLKEVSGEWGSACLVKQFIASEKGVIALGYVLMGALFLAFASIVSVQIKDYLHKTAISTVAEEYSVSKNHDVDPSKSKFFANSVGTELTSAYKEEGNRNFTNALGSVSMDIQWCPKINEKC